MDQKKLSVIVISIIPVFIGSINAVTSTNHNAINPTNQRPGYALPANQVLSGYDAKGKLYPPTSARPCPCANVTFCNRIVNKPKKEIFIFSINNANWRKYDWSKVTTVVEFDYLDDELMCFAHEKGVRVVLKANFPTNQLLNGTARTEWVNTLVTNVSNNFLDGVNVDYEDLIPQSRGDLRNNLTGLIQELNDTLKPKFPHSQLTFDFAYSPICCGKVYDYRGIAAITDFVFIMAYDDISPGQYAWANSAYNLTLHGIQWYLILGINPWRMVLGVPWYGYLYNCSTFSQKGDVCNKTTNKVSATYANIVKTLLPKSTSGRLWNDIAKSPYANFKDSVSGKMSQLWYDDQESLGIKYSMARYMGLHGVGMWDADAIDYSDEGQVDTMWGALP